MSQPPSVPPNDPLPSPSADVPVLSGDGDTDADAALIPAETLPHPKRGSALLALAGGYETLHAHGKPMIRALLGIGGIGVAWTFALVAGILMPVILAVLALGPGQARLVAEDTVDVGIVVGIGVTGFVVAVLVLSFGMHWIIAAVAARLLRQTVAPTRAEGTDVRHGWTEWRWAMRDATTAYRPIWTVAVMPFVVALGIALLTLPFAIAFQMSWQMMRFVPFIVFALTIVFLPIVYLRVSLWPFLAVEKPTVWGFAMLAELGRINRGWRFALVYTYIVFAAQFAALGTILGLILGDMFRYSRSIGTIEKVLVVGLIVVATMVALAFWLRLFSTKAWVYLQKRPTISDIGSLGIATLAADIADPEKPAAAADHAMIGPAALFAAPDTDTPPNPAEDFLPPAPLVMPVRQTTTTARKKWRWWKWLTGTAVVMGMVSFTAFYWLYWRPVSVNEKFYAAIDAKYRRPAPPSSANAYHSYLAWGRSHFIVPPDQAEFDRLQQADSHWRQLRRMPVGMVDFSTWNSHSYNDRHAHEHQALQVFAEQRLRMELENPAEFAEVMDRYVHLLRTFSTNADADQYIWAAQCTMELRSILAVHLDSARHARTTADLAAVDRALAELHVHWPNPESVWIRHILGLVYDPYRKPHLASRMSRWERPRPWQVPADDFASRLAACESFVQQLDEMDALPAHEWADRLPNLMSPRHALSGFERARLATSAQHAPMPYQFSSAEIVYYREVRTWLTLMRVALRIEAVAHATGEWPRELPAGPSEKWPGVWPDALPLDLTDEWRRDGSQIEYFLQADQYSIGSIGAPNRPNTWPLWSATAPQSAPADFFEDTAEMDEDTETTGSIFGESARSGTLKFTVARPRH